MRGGEAQTEKGLELLRNAVHGFATFLTEARPTVTFAKMLTKHHLRILAFHGVSDLGSFDQLLGTITQHCTPVDEEAVIAAVGGKTALPPRAVWVTFDDGDASVFEAGEILARRGVPATAFICPSVVDQPRRLWFETVDTADEVGLRPGPAHPARAVLKAMPDEQRRAYIQRLEDSLAELGQQPPKPLGRAALDSWMAQGHSVGNHTWDHACLDTCGEADQADQIVRAHERLVQWGVRPRSFAYPNGNHTEYSEQVLKELGYEVGVLFDHQLTRDLRRPRALSRLRIDAEIDAGRALSIVSGAHSTAFSMAQRARR